MRLSDQKLTGVGFAVIDKRLAGPRTWGICALFSKIPLIKNVEWLVLLMGRLFEG